MAGKKISELQALTKITGQEMIPVARDGQNYSVLSSLLQSGNDTKLNDYISDVTALFGKMVYRDGIGTDLANPIVGGYIRLDDGVLVQTDDSYSYQYVDVDSTKCYYLQNLISGSIVSMLALYNKDGALIKSYRNKINGYFVFKGVSKIGLSGTTSSIQQIFTIQSFGISDINTVINSRQGNRALYVAAGAVYNEQTGFYELNGLTDITEEQMREIYVKTNEMDKYSDLTSSYPGAKIRANLGFYENTYRFQKSISIFDAFRGSQFEVLKLGANSLNYRTPVSNVNSAFTSCRKLTKIIGVLDFSNITSNVNYTFGSCEKLNSVFIKNLKISIPFSDSPLLSLESLQYLITNAANTSTITVTVHADVYAKIQDETQTEWHALITSAQEKQITFATA